MIAETDKKRFYEQVEDAKHLINIRVRQFGGNIGVSYKRSSPNCFICDVYETAFFQQKLLSYIAWLDNNGNAKWNLLKD